MSEINRTCPCCGFEWNPAESNGSHDCECFLREEIERMRGKKMGVLEAVSVLSQVLEIHAFTQSDAEISDTMRQMFLKLPDLFVKLESIEGFLWDYHHALDTRQHAGIAASVLIHELEKLLETPWVRGATESTARPGSPICNGKCQPGDYDDACPLHGSGVNIAP